MNNIKRIYHIFVDEENILHAQWRDNNTELFYHCGVINLNASVGEGIQIC